MTLSEYLQTIDRPMTDWFPAYGDKPVRRGWYMTKWKLPMGTVIQAFSFWSGKQWSNTRAYPAGKPTYENAIQYKEWRGILRK